MSVINGMGRRAFLKNFFVGLGKVTVPVGVVGVGLKACGTKTGESITDGVIDSARRLLGEWVQKFYSIHDLELSPVEEGRNIFEVKLHGIHKLGYTLNPKEFQGVLLANHNTLGWDSSCRGIRLTYIGKTDVSKVLFREGALKIEIGEDDVRRRYPMHDCFAYPPQNHFLTTPLNLFWGIRREPVFFTGRWALPIFRELSFAERAHILRLKRTTPLATDYQGPRPGEYQDAVAEENRQIKELFPFACEEKPANLYETQTRARIELGAPGKYFGYQELSGIITK